MAVEVKHRRGTAAEIAARTPAMGEIWMETDTGRLIWGDGATLGGHASSLVFSDFADLKQRAFASYPDGTLLRTGTEKFAYLACSSGEDLILDNGQKVKIPDGTQWIVPGMLAANTTPGTTDMLASINTAAARAVVLGAAMRLGNKPHYVSGEVTFPPELVFEGRGGSNYANSDRTKGSKFVNGKTTAGAVVKMTGERLVSKGGHIRGLWITSGATDDLTGISLYGLELDTIFNMIVENLTVDHFNGATAVRASGNCNKLVFQNPRILIVGERVSTTGGSGYGGGMDLTNAPDSEVYNPFIEAIDGNGLILGQNSKLFGGFVDFCDKGILLANGENSIVAGTSSKFNKRNCLQLQDCRNSIISDSTFISSNRDGAAATSDDAFSIRLTSGCKNVVFSTCNFKHLQQSRGPKIPPVFKFGAAENSLTVQGCHFGDVVSGGAHIVDSNGIWAAGQASFKNNTLELGSSRMKLQTPVAFASGLTVDNETFTVTYSGSTYVANVTGATFPWTTTATFDASQWVELEERDNRGLVVPADVNDDFGSFAVNVSDGATNDWALTLGARCNIQGVVRTRGITKLMQAGASSLGPNFICDAKPSVVCSCNTATSGIVGVRGLAYPIAVSHTGSGNEDFDLFPAGADKRFKGVLDVYLRVDASNYVWIKADVDWDGTTLTTTTIETGNSGFGAPALAVAGGELVFRVSKVSSAAGTAQMNFDGIYQDTV